MSLPRLRLESCVSLGGGAWRVDSDQEHHLLRVRRCASGDTVEGLHAQDAFVRPMRLELSSEGLIARELLFAQNAQNIQKNSIEICLLVGLLKGAQFDALLHMATELGIDEIFPLYCERSVPRFRVDDVPQKMDRWRRIFASASKQCASPSVPRIHEPIAVCDLPLEALAPLRVVASLNPDATPIVRLDVSPSVKRVAVAVGPEGDWSEQELSFLADAGFVPVSLGVRVLRAGTACVAACSYLMLASQNA